MKQTVLKVGNRIEMTHEKSALGQALSDRKYASQLLDYDGFRTIKIAMPIVEGRVVPLETGDHYTLCFFSGASMYRCTGEVEKREIENTVYVIVMRMLGEPKKYQRRGFYRLDCQFPIKHREITEAERHLVEKLSNDNFENDKAREACEEELKKIAPAWKEAFAVDISGGGIRFQSNDKNVEQDEIELFLSLKNEDEELPLKVGLKVIACKRIPNGLYQYEIRGEYTDLAEENREKIIKYIFNEQRRRLRKD